ncbi:Zinc finger MYND domain-containing protein 11 [Cryptotermes secundus]|uniref:Zinc finger MYND domain-containing protein 11 n=2 Tax=Cryptotermes secundus TaxID=105785 RepID=A0A2J7PJF4_9NEOP|nr:zinc finger MYND domain-containing protein 11 isoform X1 [Cryptotermes secundus]PNF16454.1 Zinc finger MYND domain-containing protein 11 [Cryptotermes secundus]
MNNKITNKNLFSAMSRRRVACPQITQHLWDAIKVIRSQRQIPNVTRITRYMSRVHGAKEDEVRRQLNHCVRDGLVRLIKRMGVKGSKIGVEQEGYRLPQDTLVKDDHDWYCFECHAGGDVICCTSCHRVYHVSCLAKEEVLQEDVKNTFVCPVCKMKEEQKDDKPKLKVRQLNHLLGFTCARLKERLPATITDRQVPSKSSFISDRSGALSQLAQQRRASSGSIPSDHPAGLNLVMDDADLWRVDYLIYRPMDLRTMEIKASNNKYRSLQEFRADAETVVHNVVIYHGVHSILADMARQMLRDCIYDLQEIRQCRDCYRVSNEKTDKHWFCQPCRPPHQLVYAKQKGFPYWPAKVIKMDGEHYDVRFFGGHHQRALIEKSHIRSISVNIHTLQVKRTSSWNKACEELKRHQDLLEKLRNNARTHPDSSSDEEDDDDDDDDDDDNNDGDGEEESESESRPRKSSCSHKSQEGVRERREGKVYKEKTEQKLAAEVELGGRVSPEEEESSISSTSKPVTDTKEGVSQEDMVSSSCQEPRSRSVSVQTSPRLIKNSNKKSGALRDSTDRSSKDVTDKLRCEMEAEKQRALQELEEQMRLELQDLTEKHKQAISEIKKKQWCYNCESEAIYHCCWNTAYCSIECQQLHWQKEHKRVCRRKR